MNSRFLIFALCLFLGFSCSEKELEGLDVDLSLAQQTDVAFSISILEAVNTYRASINLNPIVLDLNYVSAFAVDHTLYMIEQNRISHDNFYERSKALMQLPEINIVAENVARGYTSAEDVVKAWLMSPQHKKNIEGDYTHSGIGIIKNQDDVYYFTQLFYR